MATDILEELRRWIIAQKKKRIREKHESKIMAIRRKIDRIEQATERKLEELNARYWPVSAFVEPSHAVLAEESYEMYIAESEREGRVPLPRTEEGLRVAMGMFGTTVRNSKILEFLNEDEDRKVGLIALTKRDLIEATQAGNLLQVSKLRSLLAGVGEAQPEGDGDGADHDDSVQLPVGKGGRPVQSRRVPAAGHQSVTDHGGGASHGGRDRHTETTRHPRKGASSMGGRRRGKRLKSVPRR